MVYLGAHSHGPELSSVDINRITESHYEFLGSFLSRYLHELIIISDFWTCLISFFAIQLLSFLSCSYDVAKESIFYSYTRHINGFAATLDDQVAAEIASKKSAVSFLAPCNILSFFSLYLILYIYITSINKLLSKCRTSKSGLCFPEQGKEITHNSIMGLHYGTRPCWVQSFQLDLEEGKIWRRYNYWKPWYWWVFFLGFH